MGYVTTKRLTVFSDKSRLVKLYSSHPYLAYFKDEYSKPFPLTAGRNEIIIL
jgi:hypothetical protein